MSDGLLLQDLLLSTKDGDWGKGDPEEGLVPYYVIRGTDFHNVTVGDCTRVPLRYLPERTVGRRRLEADDILIETAGGSPGRPTGRTMLVTEGMIQSFESPITCASFARFLRVDTTIANPRYVYWFLKFLYSSGQIEKFQVQHTGVARFQYTQFAGSQIVPLRARADQDAIAEILGALDDKIAASRKLIGIVDELASTKFRELLMSSSTDSSLGDVLRLDYGKSLPAPQRQAGNIDVYGSGGLTGTHNESLIDGPGVIVGRKGTVGAVYWSNGPSFPIDTTFYVVPLSPLYPHIFCYFLLKSLPLGENNSDSAVPGLNRAEALSTKIRLPEPAAIERFSVGATEMFEMMSAVDNESRTLAMIRDTLLPQLMSGKLRVRDAAKQVEAVL